jgi:hypothetical protein
MAIIASMLLLQGCIIIPVAAMAIAKIAHMSYESNKHCELAEGRC